MNAPEAAPVPAHVQETTMRSDAPPPSWYEPPAPIEDDELETLAEDEPLVIAAGVVTWRSIASLGA